MTFEEKMIEVLTKHGMTEAQVEEVVPFAKEHTLIEGLPYRWDEDIIRYSEIKLGEFRVIVKMIALDWIANNLPETFDESVFIF